MLNTFQIPVQARSLKIYTHDLNSQMFPVGAYITTMHSFISTVRSNNKNKCVSCFNVYLETRSRPMKQTFFYFRKFYADGNHAQYEDAHSVS